MFDYNNFSWKHSQQQQHSHENRPPGLTPLPLPVRRPRWCITFEQIPPVLFFFLGITIIGLLIALATLHLDRFVELLEAMMVSVPSAVVLVISFLGGLRLITRWRAQQEREEEERLSRVPVLDAPYSRVSNRSHGSGTPPAYPPEDFFSYDPLNKRPSEHFRPDQRNRF